MTYCISDIHGDLRRYRSMLSLIQFSEKDTLYILGDAIDRGPDGIDILLDIMRRPNVHMILGNHEQLLLATLGPNNEIGARKLWHQNGGDVTREDLLYHRDVHTRQTIINYLLTLPDHLDIEVTGRPFHLVHGYPAFDQFTRIWTRISARQTQPPLPGVTAIVGHTPTAFLTDDFDCPCSIWYGPGVIDIDCGCGNSYLQNRLACLRLDDMVEFYT